MESASFISGFSGEINSIARRNGAQKIRLIGSFARGDEKPDSDIDFLIVLDEGRSILDRIAMAMDLQELLGRRCHVVNEKSLHRLVRDQIMAEAKEL